MLVMLDNYDSFTYNLVQYLGEIGEDIQVFRNDKVTLDEIDALHPKHIVISPGPGIPENAGISIDVIRHFSQKTPAVPVLGVCLGHQAIAVAFGGQIKRADRLMHGKTSMISHDGKAIFTDLPNPFEATRYHSLVVDRETRWALYLITGFVGTECLNDVSKTIHVAHDFRFVEIVFCDVVLHIFDPFIDVHHLQATFFVQPFSGGNQASTFQVKTAQAVPVAFAGRAGNAFIHSLDDGVR